MISCFFNDTATTEIYTYVHTLSLHDALPIAPSLRADSACAPVLQQMASPFAGAIDFYAALREAKVPAQISLYPGETTATDETHLFHIPSNRLRAMQENLAWFDFWLRDRRDRDLDDRGDRKSVV